jgi:hypothetical protein
MSFSNAESVGRLPQEIDPLGIPHGATPYMYYT